jgi:ribosomal protein S18 acetylase RimI-like enzyme
MDILIRPACSSDLAAMAGLLEALFAVEADFAFDAAKQRAGLALLLAKGDACVLVAEREGVVVGMCTVQTVISTVEGGPVGWVEDVVVAPQCKGQGVGRKLLERLENWAVEAGLARLQLLADRDNAAALGFYGHLGWRPTALAALRKYLSAPEGGADGSVQGDDAAPP